MKFINAQRSPVIARQLGRPHGLVGHLTGRLMVRGNCCFNEWVIDQLADRDAPEVSRIVEVGSGPGLGLAYLLAAFPDAQLWGIDHSAVMLKQARNRNAAAIRSGQLTLTNGDLDCLNALPSVDLVVAVHVLYFWADPQAELRKVRWALGENGAVGVGYQLRRHMPYSLQETFMTDGHRLFDTDEAVTTLLRDAGFRNVDVLTSGPHRMQLAT